MVIQGRMLQKVHQTSSRAASRINAAKNHTADADVNQRARTHDAWFLRDIQVAIRQTPIADSRFRCLDGGTGLDLLRLTSKLLSLDLTDRRLANRLTDLEGVDLTDVVVQLQSQQNLLQLTLAATSHVFDQNLLDFIK